MGGKLYMSLSSYLSWLVTSRWDFSFSILEESCLYSKEGTNSIMELETVKDTSKFSPREGTQRSYQRKFISMVVFKVMSSSRKRWCCTTGVKLGTCLARFFLWLHSPLKILDVFFWAEWYSSTEYKSCMTWSLCVVSLLWWIPAKVFFPDEGIGWGNSFWGGFWLGFRVKVRLRILLWFWLTVRVCFWVEVPLGRSTALPLRESLSRKDQASSEETSPREPESNEHLKRNQMWVTTTKAKPEQKTLNEWEKQPTNILNKSIPTNLKPKTENLKDQKPKTTIKRPLKTLRNFTIPPIYRRWYETEIFDIAMKDIETNAANPRSCLLMAADLIDNRHNHDFLRRPEGHTEIFTIINPSTRGYAMAEVDDYLFRLAKKTLPIALREICKKTGSSLS